MSKLVLGLFTNSDLAGKAISNLKDKGYTKEISLVAKDSGGEVKSHKIKDDVPNGAATGAIIGGPLGALAGLVAGAATAAVPGGMLLIAGPIALTWGLSGAAVGALSGGLIGSFAKIGLSEEKAKLFEKHIDQGEVLVAVTSKGDSDSSVIQSMKDVGAHEIISLPVSK